MKEQVIISKAFPVKSTVELKVPKGAKLLNIVKGKTGLIALVLTPTDIEKNDELIALQLYTSYSNIPYIDEDEHLNNIAYITSLTVGGELFHIFLDNN
jgi:hypothetical protein